MRTLVTYMSLSGNTKRVAEAIFGAIEGEKELAELDAVRGLDGFDLVFVGMPAHRFGAPAKIEGFLERSAGGKRVALFVTHAMPAGAQGLEDTLARCRAAAGKAELLGTFDCQGELAEPVAEALLHSPDPNMQQFGRMRALTVGHPDGSELAGAEEFGREIAAVCAAQG